MNIRSITTLGFAALLTAPGALAAQGPEHHPPGDHGAIFYQKGPKGMRAEWVAAEMAFDLTPVKGAPYSAEAVTESVNTLADGNRIVHASRANVSRDSEGRTRREQTLGRVGPFAPSGEPGQIVIINDPVAGTHAILHPKEKVARKMPVPNIIVRREPGSGPGGEKDVIILKDGAKVDGQAKVIVVAPGEPPPDWEEAERAPAPGEPRVFERVIIEGGPGPGPMMHPMPPPGPGMGHGHDGGFRFETIEPKDAKTESLGKKTIEGVECEGTRSTVTIAAGEIGNERAIEIVSERWFSADLQTVVMSRHSDPRFGETTFKLSNVTRAEPDKTLFEIPADYTVEKDGHGPHEMRMKRRHP